jgi:hypothetical protein
LLCCAVAAADATDQALFDAKARRLLDMSDLELGSGVLSSCFGKGIIVRLWHVIGVMIVGCGIAVVALLLLRNAEDAAGMSDFGSLVEQRSAAVQQNLLLSQQTLYGFAGLVALTNDTLPGRQLTINAFNTFASVTSSLPLAIDQVRSNSSSSSSTDDTPVQLTEQRRT